MVCQGDPRCNWRGWCAYTPVPYPDPADRALNIGFGYTFGSLSGGKESELAHAFGVIFSSARKFRVITILQVWFPILRRTVRTFSQYGDAMLIVVVFSNNTLN